MLMVLAFVHLALDATGLVAGWVAARRSPRPASWIGIAALAVVLAHFGASHVPGLEARILPAEFYPFIEPWWVNVPVFYVVGVALSQSWSSKVKRGLLLVFAGLLVLRVGDLALADVFPSRLTGKVDGTGVCRQTTGYSCGAAAAATFLGVHGIGADEAEMARLCVTRTCMSGGTSASGLLRGLRRKGLDARLSGDLQVPAIVFVTHGWQVWHTVVVVEAGASEVVILDPLKGRTRMVRSEFEGVRRGYAITRTGR